MPRLAKTQAANDGSMGSAYQGGIPVDVLYLEGSRSDAQMSNPRWGVRVMMGSNSKLLDGEITNCDIGIMLLALRRRP